MNFNWGKGIAVAILAFMAFITYYLVKATTDTNYNHEFVTDNYYEKELEAPKKALLEDATRQKGMQVGINLNSPNGITFAFPKAEKAPSIKGKISFYRPNNEKLDFETPITVDSEQKMHIPHEKLVNGRWNITVEYTSGADNQTHITTFDKIKY